MRSLRNLCGILALSSAVACGGSEAPPAATGEPPPDAGPPPDMGCAPGEATLADGTCLAAGVPPSDCAAGFTAKDGGCEPILPADVCPAGTMVIPGETKCRPVAPCAPGTWGDIPVEFNTQFVDQAYAGGNSTGDMDKPWTTIQAAIDVANTNAIIAVAAGTYVEDVVIGGGTGAVKLWGRCPELVTIVGSVGGYGAVLVREAAKNTEIHDVSLVGDTYGLFATGSMGILADRVWVHDVALRGVVVQRDLGPTSITVRRSLIEGVPDNGLIAYGTELTIEETVVRGTTVGALGSGMGIGAGVDKATGRGGTLVVRSSVVEGSGFRGVLGVGSEVTIEGSVIRDTHELPKSEGQAVEVQSDKVTGRSKLTLRSSLIEGAPGVGVAVQGSDAVIESTVVRDITRAKSLGHAIGVGALDDALGRASLTLRSSLVERVEGLGVHLQGSDGVIESLLSRDNTTGLTGAGRGIDVQDTPDSMQRAIATIRASAVLRNQEMGLFVAGSDAVIESTLIAETAPSSSGFGRGLNVQNDSISGERSNVTVHACMIRDNHDVGVVVLGSDVQIDGTTIQGTLAGADGAFGDGIAVEGNDAIPASVLVSNARVAGSARAGVATFGAKVELGSTVLDCNAIHLNGELEVATPFELLDKGGNVCGCAAQPVPCKVLSSMLKPPSPVGTL